MEFRPFTSCREITAWSGYLQLFFFFIIELALPDLGLLAAKPLSLKDHFWV